MKLLAGRRTRLIVVAAMVLFAVARPWHGLRATAQSAAWSARASMLVGREDFAGTVGADGRMYIFGGDRGGTPIADSEVYDPGSNTWSEIAPMPQPVSYFKAISGWDGLIFMFGGWDGNESVNVVQVYDPVHNKWACSFRSGGCASAKVTPMPIAVSNYALAPFGKGTIQILGGFTTHQVATTEFYWPKFNGWLKGANLPNPDSGFSALPGRNNTIYVFPAHPNEHALRRLASPAMPPPLMEPDINDWPLEPPPFPDPFDDPMMGDPFDDIPEPPPFPDEFPDPFDDLPEPPPFPDEPWDDDPILDPSSDSLEIIDFPPPSPPGHLRALQVGGAGPLNIDFVFILGGPKLGGGASSQYLYYTNATNSWTSGPKMLSPRKNFLALGTSSNTIYAMGGSDGHGGIISSMEAIQAPQPPPPPPTPTPMPTLTPTAGPVTPTLIPTATFTPAPMPSATPVPPTPTTVPIRLTVRAALTHKTIAAGKKQTITVTTLPGASISIGVTYPNGKKVHHKATAGSTGTVSWTFKQPSGVTKGSNHTVKVTVSVSGATGTVVTHKTYKIK